jgi:uncharacterized repeat protein (TIGR01451 family)
VSGDANTDGILDVTETWTYEATYSITQADLDRGFFTNTASANGTYNNADGDPTPMMEASDDETVRVDADPSWTVTKTADPATYDAVNDVITYEITVENTGNVAIRSVVVTDPQATSGPTYVSGDANTDGILDVTETWTYEATYSITQADLDRGFFTNTASANGTYNNADGDPTPMMEASDDETVRVDADPSWTVTKTG